ncbi:Lipid A export ATP-binding/permease protein MsbA [uncultured delta proteobacterium]|uniref:Lipid A export ATP-binding/permease protein MsbA n=1 Tax=uncultured delta proteobacterium TaxID=34034 RepID=A0A212J360_9DELT|nr:Lipid A export ATP-binding/permease protein MsbA [uncultured delta proteobacterium]
MQTPVPERRVQSFALYKRCLGYFKPYWAHITLAAVAMLLVACTQPLVAYLVKPTMDEIFVKKDASFLLLIALAYPALELAKVSFRTIQNYVMQYCGLKVLERLRDELFQKMIFLPMRFYEGAQVGMLMSRVINDVVLIRASMPALIMLVRQIFTVIFLIGVAFYQDSFLAFWAIIVMPVAFFPFIYFGRRMRKLSRKGQAKLADISVLLQEIFSGIRVVKAFSTEEREAKRFDKENRRLLSLLLKQTLASEMSSSVMEFMGALAGALVVYYGGMMVINGVSTPGTFFSFLTATIMLYDPVKKMSTSNNDIQKALAGAERVFEILDSPHITVEKDGTIPFAEDFKDLTFENVSFRYQDGTRALDNVSLTVRQGERIALVGPSGGGKTTFVNLIPRFYEPTEGRILLNGRPLEEYTLESLRRTIAMVSQDSFLFNLSVAENILYGQEEAGEEALREAAKAAYADGFVSSLLEGYATMVGERGAKLSGGQKQRLTIARAIVKDAPLLILDEATSALDSESEGIVQKALENLMQNRTSIVIAHRLSTILNADRILVVENGRIVGQGRHEKLLLTSPLYARLYAMQFGQEGA